MHKNLYLLAAFKPLFDFYRPKDCRTKQQADEQIWQGQSLNAEQFLAKRHISDQQLQHESQQHRSQHGFIGGQADAKE